MKRLLIFIVLVLVLAIGFFLYYHEGSLPVDKTSKDSKIFIIRPGEDIDTIANNLADQKLIRNKVIFYLIVKRLGIEKKIQAGDFRLSPAMNTEEIAKTLTHGTLDVWITVIEGTRKEEIAEVVSENLDIPETEFLKYAREGYLFPDTYLIPKTATAVAVIEILENNFNSKFDEELREKAREKNLTIDQVVNLAAMIEREARFADDQLGVASALLSRLKKNMVLNIDATIQYALGYQPAEKTWWKKNLTFADLKIDSPYNTYTNSGLPPGPIASPGISAIKAVLDADENSPYIFYVSDQEGRLHFARTNAEHEENIEKYIRN